MFLLTHWFLATRPVNTDMCAGVPAALRMSTSRMAYY
jgi:hypothetical protein